MDIDLDLPTNFKPEDHFDNLVHASILRNGKLEKHPVGGYLQTMPVDPITGLAAIPHKIAERDYGFFKFDFLHLSVLNNFTTKNEIRALLRKEPNWDLLLQKSTYVNLFQLANHAEKIIKIAPKSVPELADCCALIRPGKWPILYEYTTATQAARAALRPAIYMKTDKDAYSFKKSHAHAYALTIVLQLHLIEMDKS